MHRVTGQGGSELSPKYREWVITPAREPARGTEADAGPGRDHALVQSSCAKRSPCPPNPPGSWVEQTLEADLYKDV